MKITGEKHELPAITFSELDLAGARKPPRRKTNNGVKLRRSRLETPLLRWKFNDNVSAKEETSSPELDRKCRRKVESSVSARKLAAGVCRHQLPEVRRSQAGQVEVSFHDRRLSKVHYSLVNDPVQSPRSVFGPANGHFHKLKPWLQFSHSAMEGATKWDPVGWKTAEEIKKISGHQKVHNRQMKMAPIISSLEAELECARARILQLEAERQSSKKELDLVLRKLSDEKEAWRRREHEKIRAILDDMRADFYRERKNRKRLEVINSNLVNELADTKLLVKRYLKNYEKERHARGLIEEVCDELAKELGEDKAEAEELKRESLKFTEEVDEERKMLQMAEVLREERVQMKLVDAKVMVEEKYSHMNRLIGELQSFLSSRGMSLDVEEMTRADQLLQAAASVDIRDITEFTYEPPNPDDIFSVFQDIHSVEPNEREIQQCIAYSPASHASKLKLSPDGSVDAFHRHSHAYLNQRNNLEDDGSEWETVTHDEEQTTSYSPEGSISSINKNCGLGNGSRSRVDWEGIAGDGTPVSEVSKVCSEPAWQPSELSSIRKLWKPCPGNGDKFKFKSLEGTNGRLSDGRLSNGFMHSPDGGSSKSGFIPSDLGQQWSSPDSNNSQATRGMKGCIEWPHNSQKKSLKAKLLQARVESQKIQLRQVLKQEI